MADQKVSTAVVETVVSDGTISNPANEIMGISTAVVETVVEDGSSSAPSPILVGLTSSLVEVAWDDGEVPATFSTFIGLTSSLVEVVWTDEFPSGGKVPPFTGGSLPQLYLSGLSTIPSFTGFDPSEDL